MSSQSSVVATTHKLLSTGNVATVTQKLTHLIQLIKVKIEAE
jgi:hypothetical protein